MRTDLKIVHVQSRSSDSYLAELAARAFGAAWFTSGWLKAKFLRPIRAFENRKLRRYRGGKASGAEPLDHDEDAEVAL